MDLHPHFSGRLRSSQMTSGAVLSAAPVTRPQLRPWLFALLFWLLLAAFASLVLWQLRRSALDGQTRELRLLSLSLTDEIGRGLRGAEEGLRAMRVELQQGRLPFTGPDSASMLRTRADLMPLVRALWLVDRDGRLLAASEAMPAPELPSFAPALDRLPEGAAAISRPFFADAARRDAFVALAVRLRATHDRADGWILAAVPASALLGAFGAAVPMGDARMAVFRGDGVRLAGSNMNTPQPDEASMARRLAPPRAWNCAGSATAASTWWTCMACRATTSASSFHATCRRCSRLGVRAST
jgi:hypothetical protein